MYFHSGLPECHSGMSSFVQAEMCVLEHGLKLLCRSSLCHGLGSHSLRPTGVHVGCIDQDDEST